MFDHPYIALTVPDQLSRNNMLNWYQTVKRTGPNGVCATTEISPDHKQTRYYVRPNHGSPIYVVVLSRNLNPDEANKIAEEWNKKLPDGDFDITWSQDAQLDQKHASVKEDVLKGMILEASKRAHNTWLTEKTNEGWRYGQKLDPWKKISPMCMPWENLSEKYKITEYKRMLGLIEVLNEMGIDLIRK